jgi:hypothetical protein
MAKKSISISLWPILLAVWFFWGTCDEDEKKTIKNTAVEIVVEAKEIFIETKDGTLKNLEHATDAEIAEVTGEKATQDIVEPPDKVHEEEKHSGPIGPLPDEEDEVKPEPQGRKL